MTQDISEAVVLKPCPFCGGEAVVDRPALSRLWAVYCESCEIAGPKEISKELAVASWNTRAALASQPAQKQVMGEEVREALEPFARAAKWMTEGYPDNARPDSSMDLTYADYRRAARLLTRLSAQPAPIPAPNDEERARELLADSFASEGLKDQAVWVRTNGGGYGCGYSASLRAIVRALQSTPQGEIERMRALSVLVEAVHDRLFGVASQHDPELALKEITDGGGIHETVHVLLRALPSRKLIGSAP